MSSLPAAPVRLVLNGEPRAVPEGTTVDAVIAAFVPSSAGVAVARNGAVVPRSSWSSTVVTDGDRLEVLTAAQGG